MVNVTPSYVHLHPQTLTSSQTISSALVGKLYQDQAANRPAEFDICNIERERMYPDNNDERVQEEIFVCFIG